MPCDMMSGATSGDFAQSAVDRLAKRVAAIEEALCGMIKTDPAKALSHPAVRSWWEHHCKQPGHCPVTNRQE